MSTLALDTYKAVKTLREAGFEEAQAEAMVATFGNAMSENVATKADWLALEQRMTVRLYTTVFTGVGLTIAANGIMLAALKLFWGPPWATRPEHVDRQRSVGSNPTLRHHIKGRIPFRRRLTWPCMPLLTSKPARLRTQPASQTLTNALGDSVDDGMK